MGKGAAAVGESTKRSDEAGFRGGKGFLDQRGLGVEGGGSEVFSVDPDL